MNIQLLMTSFIVIIFKWGMVSAMANDAVQGSAKFTEKEKASTFPIHIAPRLAFNALGHRNPFAQSTRQSSKQSIDCPSFFSKAVSDKTLFPTLDFQQLRLVGVVLSAPSFAIVQLPNQELTRLYVGQHVGTNRVLITHIGQASLIAMVQKQEPHQLQECERYVLSFKPLAKEGSK